MTHLIALIVVTFLFYWKTRRLRASKKKTRENLCQHPGSIFIIVTFWSDENFIAQLLRWYVVCGYRENLMKYQKIKFKPQ